MCLVYALRSCRRKERVVSTTDVYINFYTDEEGQGIFSFGNDTPQPTTGLTKLLVHWLKAFFTDRGSDLFDPDYGTFFPRLLGSTFGDISDVFEIVSISINQATDAVQANQNETEGLSDAELLKTARLESLEAVGADGVALSVILQNAEDATLLVRVNTASDGS